MMKKFFISIGIVILMAPLAADAQGISIYQHVKKMTEQELFPDKEAEDVLKKYVPDAYPGLDDEIYELDIDAALQQRYGALCAGKKKTGYYGACLDAAKRIGMMVSEESRIRGFGRQLQYIATSYELPLSVELNGTQNLLTRLLSVIRIWQSGTYFFRTSSAS